jgi:TrmH family RNA methyltransferase
VAEGFKTVAELLKSNWPLHHLYITDSKYADLSSNHTLIPETDLKKISNLSTPNDILGVFEIPEQSEIDFDNLVIALDDVRDPGNLGTIIRLCDWFGVKELICSKNTVDCYNPKVVQSTMGSLARVNMSYMDLEDILEGNKDKPIIGTFMNGENLYEASLPKKGIIIMGNEANGISESVSKLVKQRLAIPRFGELKATESLNVATATAIILSEFKRSY